MAPIALLRATGELQIISVNPHHLVIRPPQVQAPSAPIWPIAFVSAIPDFKLVLIDIAQDAFDRAAQRIEGYADKSLKCGKLTSKQAASVRAKLITSLDYSAMAGCDWVLEAATENLELKRKIFSEVESLIELSALITSSALETIH